MDMILSSDGPVEFLERSHYERKAGPIHPEDDEGYAAYYEAVQAEMERYLEGSEYDEEEYYEDDGEYDE